PLHSYILLHLCFLFNLVEFVSFLFFSSSRRRHTRSKRDWSSDVCSSDLYGGYDTIATITPDDNYWRLQHRVSLSAGKATVKAQEIGRASCRERVENEGVEG